MHNKAGRENKPEAVIEIPVPMIVPRDKFDRVQELLISRQPACRGPRLDASPALLGGLIRCAGCGAIMVAGSGTARNGVVHNYYECQGRRKKGPTACAGMRIARLIAETKVMDALLDELITPDRIFALLMSLKERRNRSQGAVQDRVADLQRETADAETALAGLYALVERGLVDPTEPTLGERLQKLIQRRDLCRQARDRALAALSTSLDVDAARVRALALDLRQRANDWRDFRAEGVAQRRRRHDPRFR